MGGQVKISLIPESLQCVLPELYKGDSPGTNIPGPCLSKICLIGVYVLVFCSVREAKAMISSTIAGAWKRYRPEPLKSHKTLSEHKVYIGVQHEAITSGIVCGRAWLSHLKTRGETARSLKKYELA